MDCSSGGGGADFPVEITSRSGCEEDLLAQFAGEGEWEEGRVSGERGDGGGVRRMWWWCLLGW